MVRAEYTALSHINLRLGPVSFRNFEIPSKINFGGQQRLVVHTLADGSRVVDELGPFDADIRFSGILSGPDATERALLLDRLRISGDALSLTWDIFFYSIILKQITFDFENEFWIPFEVSCTVIDQSVDQVSDLSAQGTNAIASDLQALVAFEGLEGANWATAKHSVTQRNSCVQGTVANSEAKSAAGAIVTSIGYECANRGTILDSFELNNVDEAVATLAEVDSVTQAIWKLTIAGGIWGRIYRNVLCSST
jgi:hypothetical protein